MKKKLLFPLLFLTTIAWAQADRSIVQFVNPTCVSTPNGYSHATIIDVGNCYMVLISGQVALDSTGTLVGEGDFKKQTEQVFLNLKNIVVEAGGTMDNIVKTGIYLLDVAQMKTFREIRDKFISLKNPPASTLVQVSKLFRQGILIEVEATAVIPKK